MTNLIIGCGYIGRRVAALWRQQGHRVLATTRHRVALPDFSRLGLESVICDVLSPAPLRSLPPLDTVLYAVGFDRSSGSTMRDVYITGLARVLDALPPVRRFIHVSSSSVYGQTDGAWVDEDSPTHPQEESGQIVLEAERVLKEAKPDAMILRLAGIYGTGRLLRQKTIAAGEPIIGDPDKWLNLIHADDGARAILAAADRFHPGLVVNVCDDHPVSRRDFYAELARLLSAPPPHFVPPPADQPTPPHEKAHRRIRNRRLKEALGYSLEYPSFREGLAASIAVGPS